MNFCGSDYEKQVQDTKLLRASFHCSPCMKDEHAHLDAVFSEDGLDAVFLDPLQMDRRKNPLDVIEERLDRDVDHRRSNHVTQRMAPLLTMHERPAIQSLISNASSTTVTSTTDPGKFRAYRENEWDDEPTSSRQSTQQHELKRSASGSIDGLLKRLENGFRVRLHTGPRQASEDVLIYLDSRRNRLCLRGDQEGKKMEHASNYWQELPIAQILRLEIDRKQGRSRNTLQSFSLILESDNTRGTVYYDFEAETPIEREIIVATLMVVLEQARNIGLSTTEDDLDQYDVSGFGDGGTMEQPIVCSPSLEEQINVMAMDREEYSPQDGKASVVINLEHLDDSATLSPRMDALRRLGMSQNDLSGGPSMPTSAEMDEIECKGSTQLTSAWCTDDVCTLALKDIADTCSGIFVLKQAEAGICSLSGITEEQRLMIEEYIASALGAPSAMYSFLSEADVWNAQVENEEATNASQGRIRNRASVLNAQCDRLHSLRQEMTFAAALKVSQEHMALQTTQSFDDAKQLKSKQFESKVVSQLHSSALLKHIVGNMMMSSPTQEEEGAVAFYDSDPEDARPKALSKKDPRQITADCRKREAVIRDKPVRALIGPGFDKVKSSKRVSKKLDEDTIVQIVQQMTNERLTLMLHPNQGKNEPNRSPICVKLWIESGVCLIDGTFILPKLSWVKYETAATAGRHVVQTEPQKLDLLDVCRIHTAETIDRYRNPFAVARKSFLIETQTQSFMFEAQTTEECERIVFALKLVIARLASLLMLRDVRAAEEFFGAFVATVPGEAPEWTKPETGDVTSHLPGNTIPFRE